jgi:SSS family solute:Na+ symporter
MVEGTKKKSCPALIEVDTKMFRVSPGFVLGSILIMGVLTALYTLFW